MFHSPFAAQSRSTQGQKEELQSPAMAVSVLGLTGAELVV